MAFGGLFLSWNRPTWNQQKACISASGSFNYDPQFRGASREPGQQDQALSAHGFFINRARVLLGTGPVAFRLAKSALASWSHFQLGWAFVDPETRVRAGTRFCVCVKEPLLVPLLWIMMPLQVAYVSDVTTPRAVVSGGSKGSFGFGSGTLRGHLLAGEERFSIEWDENDQVWYEIYSFSKPAHFLSLVGYPYVQLRQKLFAQRSTQALIDHVTTKQAKA